MLCRKQSVLCKNLVNESPPSNEEVRPEILKGAHLHRPLNLKNDTIVRFHLQSQIFFQGFCSSRTPILLPNTVQMTHSWRRKNGMVMD